MYGVFLTLQIIAMILIILELLYVVTRKPSKLQMLLVILLFSLLINFIGATFEMRAKSYQEALMAIKIIYLGKPYIIISIFLVVAEFCRVRLPKAVVALLVFFQLSITSLVFTCQYHSLYYTSMVWTEEGLFPHIQLGHGVFYFLYIGIILVYGLVILILCVRNLMKKNSRNEKIQIINFVVMITVALLTFVVYITDICKGYDVTSMGYLFGSIILSISLFRYKLIDTVSFAISQAMDYFSEGILVLDNYVNVFYSNDTIRKIYHLKNQSKFEKEELLKDHIVNKEYIFSRNKVYEPEMHKIAKDSQEYGVLYILKDITILYRYTNDLEAAVEEKTKDLMEMQRKITLGMADVINSRDTSTGGHVKRTSDVVKIFAQKLMKNDKDFQYKEIFLNNVIKAAPLHDLGKIGVHDAILNKPGRFTPEEYQEMQTHAEKGASILKKVLGGVKDEEFVKVAVNMAIYHHEKWDGSGYPKGTKGRRIPLEARIMSLADVFDALVSKRVYKDAMPYDEAFKIIEDSLGSSFDPELGKEFLECRDKLIKYYDAQRENNEEE